MNSGMFFFQPHNNDGSNFIQNVIDNSTMKRLLERIGTAEDGASLISFLISDDSYYMTGENINVDGGVILDLQ